YIRGKPLGKLIWNSIQNGPSPHPMVTDAPTEGQTGVNMPRMKLDSEFTPEETNRENADTQAEIILSQGLPRHIFNILNQTNTAKEIWDNVEMLMLGSGRTLQQRKGDLFDEFKQFRAIGNEPIHDYFVCFHKLVNDMKITQLAIPTHQLNPILSPNVPSYWGKYVTNVKQNMDISTTNYVHIYTHLKAYEPHATKTLKKQEQSSSIIDPLAYMAQATPTTSLPPLSTSQPQHCCVSKDAMMAQLYTDSKSFKWFPKARRAPGNVGNTGSKAIKVNVNVLLLQERSDISNCRGKACASSAKPKRAKILKLHSMMLLIGKQRKRELLYLKLNIPR
ncbi:hypothetical protein Tco_0360900, partial [Tanacetum coccineum]